MVEGDKKGDIYIYIYIHTYFLMLQRQQLYKGVIYRPFGPQFVINEIEDQ